jgi:long-chain fatty acid transport protein
MKTSLYLPALISLCSVLILGSTPARGSGLSSNQHSAGPTGMAGAVTAIADTPAAGYYNPAGLATQTGLNFEAGFTINAAEASYKGIAPGTGQEVQVDGPEPFYLPSAHVGYRIHERVAAGLSFYFPYGLGAAWPETVDVGGTQVPWWGRGVSKSLALFTFSFNPNVAVKLHERIYVGGGVTVMKGVMTMERALTMSSQSTDDLDMKFSGEGWGVGGTAGLLVKVLPDLLNVGATYRSAVDLTLKGQVGFTRNGSADNISPSLRSMAVDGDAEADLPLPHTFSFGLAVFPVEPLTVGLSFDFQMWTSYESLEIRFPDNPGLNVSEPKAWQNTLSIRAGLEYRVLPDLPLRAGFIWEQGPVPGVTRGPDAPLSDRYVGTAGAGYAFSDFRVDVAYQFMTTGFAQADEGAALDGSYRLRMHVASISLGYKLDI